MNQPTANAGPTSPPKWPEILLVSGAYLGLSLIATYPAVKFFTTGLLGAGDTAQNAWNLWWMHHALLARHAIFPYDTTMLYYPLGVSLAYHTLDPLNGWLAFPLLEWLKLGLPAAFNTLALLSFVMSGAGMYLLVRAVGGSPTAAMVAGVIFPFSPFRMSRVVFGNLEVYSTQFIPWLVWFLIKGMQEHRRKYALGAAMATALTAWCSLELAFGAGLLAMLWLAFDMANGGHWQAKLRWWSLFGVTLALAMSTVAMPMIRSYADFHDQEDQRGAAVWNSADLLGFFVPDNATAPTLKRLLPRPVSQSIAHLYGSFYGNPCEKTVFVGYGVLLMVSLAFIFAPSPPMRRWLVIGGTFFLLCLGPVLHIAGHPAIPMPYAAMMHVPLVKFGRTPSRLAVYVTLSLAMIVGYGWSTWERQHPRLKWGTLLGGVIVFLEFLVVPLPVDTRISQIPAYYYQLATAERGAVLDVPMDLYGAQGPAGEYMLYQTVHQHPIVGGYISRTPSKALWPLDLPFLSQLRARIYDDHAPYEFSTDVLAHGMADLRAVQVRYVILHPDKLSAEAARTVRAALVSLLSEPLYEDRTLVVWKVSP